MSQSTARKARRASAKPASRRKAGTRNGKPALEKQETFRLHKLIVQAVGIYEVDGETKAEIPLSPGEVFPANLDGFPKDLRERWPEIEKTILAAQTDAQHPPSPQE